MEELTIVGWLWRDEQCAAQYRPEHVNAWARMIHQHLSIPHRFVLVTDQPDADYDPLITTVPLWDDWREVPNPKWGPKKPKCYVRLKAFSKEAREILGPRFVSIDLDCLVLGSLDALFMRKEDFLICKRIHPTYYNGSMWMMTAGARSFVWEDFNGAQSVAEAQKFIGSDQAWLCYRLGPNEKGWQDVRDGVYGWTRIKNTRSYYREPPRNARIIFFYGGAKPWNLWQRPLLPAQAPRWVRHPRPGQPQVLPARPSGLPNTGLPESNVFKWVTEAYQAYT